MSVAEEVAKLEAKIEEQRNAMRALLFFLEDGGQVPPSPPGHFWTVMTKVIDGKPTWVLKSIGPDWGQCHTAEDHEKTCVNPDEEDSEGPMTPQTGCYICTHPPIAPIPLPDPRYR